MSTTDAIKCERDKHKNELELQKVCKALRIITKAHKANQNDTGNIDDDLASSLRRIAKPLTDRWHVLYDLLYGDDK